MLIETVGYQGDTIFLAAGKVAGFQHRKNMTPNGVAGRPQTTVWIICETTSEVWIVLEDVESFKRKYIAALMEGKN